jgi:hypothetical protein
MSTAAQIRAAELESCVQSLRTSYLGLREAERIVDQHIMKLRKHIRAYETELQRTSKQSGGSGTRRRTFPAKFTALVRAYSSHSSEIFAAEAKQQDLETGLKNLSSMSEIEGQRVLASLHQLISQDKKVDDQVKQEAWRSARQYANLVVGGLPAPLDGKQARKQRHLQARLLHSSKVPLLVVPEKLGPIKTSQAGRVKKQLSDAQVFKQNTQKVLEFEHQRTKFVTNLVQIESEAAVGGFLRAVVQEHVKGQNSDINELLWVDRIAGVVLEQGNRRYPAYGR